MHIALMSLRVIVWYFMNDTGKVMAALILAIVLVLISLELIKMGSLKSSCLVFPALGFDDAWLQNEMKFTVISLLQL
jgi:hypothetical protein